MKVVLCMIVKNEGKIIERCLNSAIDVIDEYCIVDTGSEDNTVDLINTFFKSKNIPGTVHNREWKNFGHNRTESIDLARKSKCEWILTLDADMLLVNEGFDKSSLDGLHTHYELFQKNNSIKYTNIRMMNSKYKWKSVGVTHEYLAIDGPAATFGKVLESLWINDIGDGGSKSDKFERDISLLTQGLIDEPNNDRYMFYLAQSYKDTSRFEEAIEWYSKRIITGGWYEEIWYSHYMISQCYIQLNQLDKAEEWAMKGFSYYPKRAEAIYSLCKKFREIGNHEKSLKFYNLGKDIQYPEHDKLFIEHSVYNDKLFEYEMSIIHYYVYPNQRSEGLMKCVTYMHYNPKLSSSIFNNLKFYVKSLSSQGGKIKELDVDNVPSGYINSSWCKLDNISNVRLVNYKIDKSNGSYKYLNGDRPMHWESLLKEPVSTLNLLNGKDLMEEEYEVQVYPNSTIKGIEDIRLFKKKNGEILFMATTPILNENHSNRICAGVYDVDNKKIKVNKVFDSPTNSGCEKNWVFLNENEIIYSWNPLTIYSYDNLKLSRSYSTPQIFSLFRGSSSIVKRNGLCYAIVHTVNYENPRTYLHYLMVMLEDGMPIAHSLPFSFEGNQIEYCLSFNFVENNIEFNYSTWDSTSKSISIESSYFMDKMIYINTIEC
jgi:tetratricopeptide (TPR) repeat protein